MTQIFRPIVSISNATSEGVDAVCGILVTNDKSVANIAQKMCDLVYNVVNTTDQHVSQWSRESLESLTETQQALVSEVTSDSVPAQSVTE